MDKLTRRNDTLQPVLERLEPAAVAHGDFESEANFLQASAAISLKRIADSFENLAGVLEKIAKARPPE